MKRGFLVLILILLVSCAEKLIEEPENLIAEDKMTDILYDLSLLVAVKNTSRAILEDNDIEIMEYLYVKHKIDSVQFVQSDLYYASTPAIYESIYRKVETRLEATKKEMQDARMKKSDSVAEKANKKRAFKEIQKPSLKKD
ncbi:hypothetical protein GGR42_001603 [Saonia flava]|uniref:DUF4296 domain-containing protein n=1 Tax=Saonia flava TaxID=523696 RepID=A0A846QSJ7_9FLAO|nr:DUF4296 domain-containing protein [Saonia flava]NJB71141.1 hypothetical protein [Saonia flava]